MKAANSYTSLLRGVSQQVPQERAEGQHTEQVNMLSDPVNGLVRRPGSIWQAEKNLANLESIYYPLYSEDTENYRTLEFQNGGKEYAIMYRTGTKPDYSGGGGGPGPGPGPGASGHGLELFLVYNKTDKVFLNYQRGAGDTPVEELERGGISAIAAVGKYLFSTGNTVPITGTSAPKWDTGVERQKAVVWFRGGAYSRTFTVKLVRESGERRTWKYTTPSSSYPSALNTSDIAAADPEYTKKVNDRVNAYNSEVTAWIGTAAAAIQPDAIAEQFAAEVMFIWGWPVQRVGSHVCFPDVVSVEVDDGGDGSFIRGVANTIKSEADVTLIHYKNKVVKVSKRNSDEVFYLKAVPKDPTNTDLFLEVTWIEAAGVENSISTGFFYSAIVGNNFYTASSAAELALLTAGPHPTFPVSTAGDNDSAPPPYFVGRYVTYLGAFKNRLIVGSGGTVSVSKVDDYLNFYRSTVLTLPADDPFEMLPQGSEDDIMRYGVLYNQDLVIFGKDRQYVTRGDQGLSPTSANLSVMANFDQAAESPPLAAGSYIFYNRGNSLFTGLYQIQPGQIENSPDSFPASSQIDSYLLGNAIELVSVTGSPSIILLRTKGKRDSVYTFAYLDRPDGRKMDAWSRWEFNLALGNVIGMSPVPEGILVFFLRESQGDVYVVADLVPLNAAPGRPHLDSQRPYAAVAAGTGSVVLTQGSQWAAAYGPLSSRQYLGSPLPDVAALRAAYPGEIDLVVGALQEAYIIPTNPFMRDGKDKAILSGRLTITKLTVAYRRSVGFKWSINYRDQVTTENSFNGRLLGDPTNLIGYINVSDGQYTVPIGRETRQYELTIAAREWYPFTLTAIEWTGQFFNRVQRF